MLNPMQLEALLQRRYGSVKRGKGGRELITKCPVCGKRKLSVNTITGLYQCWHGCVSGHVDKLFGDVRIARNEQIEFRKAAPIARGVDLPGELVPLMSLSEEHQAIQYLINRGFNPKELDEIYGLRYCSMGKKYAGGLFDTSNTLVIPVYADGLLTGWQSRLLYDPKELDDATCTALGFPKDEDGDWLRPPKYFTMPGLDKGKILYNYDWARRSNLVVVCEGVFDALAVGRCAVATFGKGVTEYQANILKSYWDLIIILLDPGDAEADMIKLNKALDKGTAPTFYVMLQGYKDAGETPREEIWRQIDQTMRDHPVLGPSGKTLDTYQFIV